MKVLILAGLLLMPGFAGDKDGPKQRKVRLSVGQIFHIRLPGNPTTGYEWELKSIDRTIAEPTGTIRYRQNPAPAGMVGVGGSFSLAIRGVKAGKTKVVLVYRRSWEKVAPLKTYTVELEVL